MQNGKRLVIFFNVSHRKCQDHPDADPSFRKQGDIMTLLQAGIPAARDGKKHVTMDDIMPKPAETVDALQRFDRGLLQAEEEEKLVSDIMLTVINYIIRLQVPADKMCDKMTFWTISLSISAPLHWYLIRRQGIRVGRWWPKWFLPLVLTGKNRLAKTLGGKKWQKVIKTKWHNIKLNIDLHISMHHIKQSEVI